MVTVKLFNLLRSKYRISEVIVHSGSIHEIIQEMIKQYPNMEESDFKTAIVFYQGFPIHYRGFHKIIPDNKEIIITHFVGGG